MALLGKIRERAWIMVVLVALGVGGFLLMDVSNYAGLTGGSGPRYVGKVNGREITFDQMSSYLDELGELAKERGLNLPSAELQSIAWEQLVQEALVEAQASELGLKVTENEMADMFVGENISPQVASYFNGMGMMDAAQIRSYVNQIEGLDPATLPADQQEEIAKRRKELDRVKKRAYFDRLSGKYQRMLQKAAYTPKWMNTVEYNRQNQSFALGLVRIPYSSIPNESVKVEDADLTKYIQDNPKRFKRKATVSLEFALFDVVASEKDSAAYLKKMQDLYTELAATKDDTAFARRTGAVMPSAFLSKDDLKENPEMKDSMFTAGEGTTFGPYVLAGEYKILKVLERKKLVDSVRYRTIVLFPQDQNQVQSAVKTLDSLKLLVKEGKASFDSLAAQNSQDPAGKLKGGDQGWVGKKPLNMMRNNIERSIQDHIFYIGKKDSLDILYTADGRGIQLVQITDYKISDKDGIRVVALTEPIIPSKETTNAISAQATDFIAKNQTLEAFRESVTKGNIKRGNAGGLELNGFEIAGLGRNETAARIIKWAHTEGKVKQIASEAYPVNSDENDVAAYVKQFVVPVLVSRLPEGLASIEDESVRNEVMQIVRNERKAAAVKDAIKTPATLEEVATKYSSQVENLPLRYMQPMLGMGGTEPKVAAVADLLEAGKISTAIGGREAIYVIRVDSKTPAPTGVDEKISRAMLARSASSLIGQLLAESLRDKATIEDNRAQVY